MLNGPSVGLSDQVIMTMQLAISDMDAYFDHAGGVMQPMISVGLMEINMIRRPTPVLPIAIFLMLLSCSSGDIPLTYNSIHGSGDLIDVLREVDPFHSVILNTVGNVNLTFDTEQKLVVTVDHNLLKFITTDVTGGVLVIDRNVPNDVKVTGQSLTVDVTMSSLRSLTLDENGVGSFATDSSEFQVDSVNLDLIGVGDMDLELAIEQRLHLQLSGVGNVTLVGSADRFDCEHSAVGNVEAFDLAVNNCTVVSSGVGDTKINVAVSLDVTIDSAGSVYYKGRPSIDSLITGAGQLIDAN